MKRFILLFFIVGTAFGQQQTIDHVEINKAKVIAREFLKKERIPGMSISVSQHGSIVWSQGFGFANLETRQSVSPRTTQFRIASISKPICALGLAKLVDDGKLEFDHSIYTYIPDFPQKAHDFTIRQVAGHIAGIRHYNGSEFIMNKKMTIVEGLDIFKDSPLKFKPGTRYSYSTYGWNLLSVVVQNASKQEFNTFMKTQIFDPLKMYNTTVGLSDVNMPNRTKFYRKTNAGNIVLGPQVSNEFKVAGGGFIATSEDLVRFGNEIISPQVLSEDVVKELVTSQKTNDGKLTNYGIGFNVGQTKYKTPRYSHSGGGIGATTFILIYPEEEIVIAIVTNLSQVPIRQLTKQLEDVFIRH